MSIRFKLLLYILLLCIGCQNSTEKKDITIKVDNDNITAKFSDLFATIDIIPLETQDSSLISSTDKMIWHNNQIFILDKTQQILFVFDEKGKFLWKLDKAGRGPTEYLGIEDIVINPETDNIEIISSPGQYIIYNPQGDFMQAYKIPANAIHAFFPINKDLTAFYEKVQGNLLIYSKKENKIIRAKPMSEEFILRKTPYHYIISPFSCFQQEILFLAADQKKVYKISQKTGEITEKQSFNFGAQDHELRNLPKDQEMMYYITENKNLQKIYCISDFKETPDYMVVYYIYEKFWHTTFYNKATQTTTTFNKPSGIMIYYPFDCNEQSLISIIPANIVERQVQKEWINQQEWEKIQQIPIDANPIVLKYNFKSH